MSTGPAEFELPEPPDLSELSFDEYAELLTEVDHIAQEKGED